MGLGSAEAYRTLTILRVRENVEASNRLCTLANAHSRPVEVDEIERARLHGVRSKDH